MLFGESYEVFSAGTTPSFVHPKSIQVMQEIGIDISGYRSKSLTEFLSQPFDYIMTVCGNADQKCPVFPGNGKRLHWAFDDPAHVQGSEAYILDCFRRVRDDILKKFRDEWLRVLV